MTQRALKWDDRRFEFESYLRSSNLKPAYKSSLGALFAMNCMKVLPHIRDEVVDCVFADPPFNLGKEYGKNSNDAVPDGEYVRWCKSWLDECVRVLRPGGSIFVYNLPKWNVILGAHLTVQGMAFRHWIAVEISSSLPISGRLHPSHYGLLYYTKGKPRTFHRIRTPILTCRHCGGELKDYGGHRGAMNPKGVTLKDVWTDIPPVRHWKFKSKSRRANALSINPRLMGATPC
ncbi:MAG: site-specific DNA-methyltransferase [Cyanobacteria bacterium]|nr:site-specific DNA-methyltransferase [Cyanobacteriota bacterium]